MDVELMALCTQQVRFYAQTTVDEYGFQTWSKTPQVVNCHMESRVQLFATRTGEMKTQSGRCFLAGVFPWLTDRYLMEVPDVSTPSGWRQTEILAVTVRYNESAADHQVVHFGERGDRGRETNE
jgi:hypothetical protein